MRKLPKIFISNFRCRRHHSQEILEVIFMGPGGSQFFWRPRWDDVRLLINKAIITEVDNTIFDSPQFKKFRIILEPLYELAKHGEQKTKERHNASTQND